jgi:hypothetical protein
MGLPKSGAGYMGLELMSAQYPTWAKLEVAQLW